MTRLDSIIGDILRIPSELEKQAAEKEALSTNKSETTISSEMGGLLAKFASYLEDSSTSVTYQDIHDLLSKISSK